jgi:hypothetical protein
MANYARAILVFCFFSCFLLFTAINPVFGGGNREPDLSIADELIELREYEEAMELLSQYARTNPRYFEHAQERLRKIYQLRENFNIIADELIETLEEDPDNSEKIYELTLKLRELENENSPIMINFVARVHEIAQFNVYRNRLRNILERGRNFLDRGDSEGAILVYAGGMDFMRDEFFAAGYEERILNEVIRERERINSTIAAFQPENAQIRAISTELVRAINTGQTARLPEITSRLTFITDRLIALKRDLYASVSAYDRILEELRRNNPDMGDRNHLSFVSRVIHGRSNETIQEGMLGAFENSWQHSEGAVIETIIANLERVNSAGQTALIRGNYQAVLADISGVESISNLHPPFFAKHRELHEMERAPTISLYGTLLLRNDISPYLKIRALNEANSYLRQAASVAMRQNIDRSALTSWQNGIINVSQALSVEQQTRNLISGMQREIEDIRTRGSQADREISSYIDVAYIKDTLRAIDTLDSSLASEALHSAQRYYTIAHGDLNQSLTARRTELENGRNHLNGQTRYPAEAFAELNAMITAVTADIERGNSYMSQNRNEAEEITANVEIVNLRNRNQTILNEMNSIRSQGQTALTTARSQMSQAEAYRQEGERIFREAQLAYQRQDFDIARNRLEQAAARLTSSLEIQESAAVRQLRDTQLVNLGLSIAAAENEMIITEVRNLLTTSRTLYFEGNFQQAENNLVRARNRWRVTNIEENEEVVYWLGMVRNAMSASSSRNIPTTAPLYPEMSQLLSQAQRNYQEGVRLINAGQRTQGIAKFDEARRQTREVKLMYPINQEAGILELRMEQFTDPAAFNASFEQRLRTAQNLVRQTRSIEAFADLQNLAEINPSYPGIRGIITQAEIDIGRRPPPPNPADIARSRELTAAASRIVEGRLSNQYDVALAQINEALSLYPGNTDAERVKDRLQVLMNVPSGVVLSSEDEETYQRAMREFQAGNNLMAYSLVERLMQNPRNRNITKLTDLQRRIEAGL